MSKIKWPMVMVSNESYVNLFALLFVPIGMEPLQCDCRKYGIFTYDFSINKWCIHDRNQNGDTDCNP